MAYELMRYESGEIKGCDYCSCEVPLDKFKIREENLKENFYELCEFCAGSIGREWEPVNKRILSQMMNILLRKLKE